MAPEGAVELLLVFGPEMQTWPPLKLSHELEMRTRHGPSARGGGYIHVHIPLEVAGFYCWVHRLKWNTTFFRLFSCLPKWFPQNLLFGQFFCVWKYPFQVSFCPFFHFNKQPLSADILVGRYRCLETGNSQQYQCSTIICKYALCCLVVALVFPFFFQKKMDNTDSWRNLSYQHRFVTESVLATQIPSSLNFFC